MNSESAGEFLHTKHAFPPNSLGYCGPDVRGKIQDYLHNHDANGEALLSTLTKFEAAYPFVKMIAKSTGRKPFDYKVTEAYWLGNSLLNHVEPVEFFEFAHKGINSRLPKKDSKLLFEELGAIARPHHTFYVLGMYARPASQTANRDKILELMDSCRISWGKVMDVKDKELIVERRPLTFADGDEQLLLSKPVKKKVAYDREISPFDTIKSGDWVSLHWNFASEKLTPQQVRNLKVFTAQDIKATNLFADILQRRGTNLSERASLTCRILK